MRERYRKTRRRQQAQLLLLGCGVLLAGALALLAWRSLHRPRLAAERPAVPTARAAPRPSKPASTKLPAPPPVKVAGEVDFDPAPWLLETDGEQLFCAVDERPFSEAGPYYTCDALRARGLRGKPAWEQTGEFKLGALDYAGGMLVGLQEQLADKSFHLTGYSAADGRAMWTADVADAANPQLYASGKQAIVAYAAGGGYRLSCFSSENGAKVWGLKLTLRGLNRALLKGQDHGEQVFQLFESGDTLVYVIGNVLGMVDRRSGKPLRSEFTATGALLSPVIEEQTQTAYVRIQGNQVGSVSLMAIPLGAGSAKLAARGLGADNRVFFVPGPDWLLTGYRRLEEGAPRLVLECKKLDDSGQTFKHELAGGLAVCGALVPGTGGTFLVGVAAEAAHPEAISGARQFYLVAPAAGTVEEAGRTPQPAFEVLPFRDNLVALCDGGQLQRFDPGRRSFRLLKKLRYPQFSLTLSDDRRTLLIAATGEEYFHQEPGQPLQAVLLQ
jgi:hypothetical protein